MHLFEDVQRTYLGYREPHEKMYAFLNRSAHPEYERTRSVLEMWFNDVPEIHRYALKSSFSSADQQHLGAFFEIYCHTLLRKQGFSVHLQQVVDPAKGNPIDFLVQSSDTPLFYLEATVALDSGDALKSQRHLSQLWEALNQLNNPFFHIIMDVEQISSHSIPATQIRKELYQWLQKLDPDEVSQMESRPDHDMRPRSSWERDGWRIEFIAVPKSLEERNQDGETVLYQFSSGKWSGIQNTLRRTLDSKADKYGNFQLPYIIAVDVLALDAIGCDIEEVFFGQDIILVNPESGEMTSTRSPLLPNRPHKENGFWLARRGPRNQQVSAVLLVDELMPWSLARKTPVLWHNPWAEKPLDPEIWRGPQMVPDMGVSQLIRCEGKPAHELLHLESSWPY